MREETERSLEQDIFFIPRYRSNEKELTLLFYSGYFLTGIRARDVYD